MITFSGKFEMLLLNETNVYLEKLFTLIIDCKFSSNIGPKIMSIF